MTKTAELGEEYVWEVLHPTVPVEASKKEAKMVAELEFACDYRQQPTNDIAAQVMKAVEVIRSVAYKSKNLHGGFQKGLEETAFFIKAATTKLAERSQMIPGQHPEVLEELHKELQDMRCENEKLRKEVAHLREKMERGEHSDLRIGPPLLERKADHMEVEVRMETPSTWVSLSLPILRKKRKATTAESNDSGEGEVLVASLPPPPLTPEPFPLPLPQA